MSEDLEEAKSLLDNAIQRAAHVLGALNLDLPDRASAEMKELMDSLLDARRLLEGEADPRDGGGGNPGRT